MEGGSEDEGFLQEPVSCCIWRGVWDAEGAISSGWRARGTAPDGEASGLWMGNS
jgi:hypothetical protein